jgi:hypothetical protein
LKTTIKPLRPDAVWQPPIGAPKGNKNALKTGRYTAEKQAARKQIARLIKRAHVAMAEVEKRLPRRKPGPKGGARIPSQGG